jgi:hypothetical protein
VYIHHSSATLCRITDIWNINCIVWPSVQAIHLEKLRRRYIRSVGQLLNCTVFSSFIKTYALYKHQNAFPERIIRSHRRCWIKKNAIIADDNFHLLNLRQLIEALTDFRLSQRWFWDVDWSAQNKHLCPTPLSNFVSYFWSHERRSASRGKSHI